MLFFLKKSVLYVYIFLFLHCCYYSSYVVVIALFVLMFLSHWCCHSFCMPLLLLSCGVVIFLALVFLLHWCYCFSRVVLLFFLHCDVVIVALMLLFSLYWCYCSCHVGAIVLLTWSHYSSNVVLILLSH